MYPQDKENEPVQELRFKGEPERSWMEQVFEVAGDAGLRVSGVRRGFVCTEEVSLPLKQNTKKPVRE